MSAAAGLIIGVVAVPGTAFATPPGIGSTSGPLTNIDIGNELNCAVNHSGDSAGEWFDDTACATLLATGGTLYGPDSIPAGASASPRTDWTPVSQSAVSGSGTTGDPYKIVTVVDGDPDADTSGLRVTQTDTYVSGQESYRTDIAVSNPGSAAATAVLYRGGDCYLQDSDTGYGQVDSSTGAVSCTVSQDPGSRIEQMLPLTSGSSYVETYYNTMWGDIGSQQALPDTCDCANSEDNAVALSWNVSLAAGASKTYSSLVTFSPLGHQPLTLAKTADSGNAVAGGADGYTITATNNNVTDVTLSSLTDTLPAGFTYTPGSSTGATTTNPTISGQQLSWSGISVPAGGSVSLHFGVTVSSTAGTYTDDAEGTATDYTVVGTGATAPVTVSAAANHPPVASNKSVTTPQNTAVAVTLSATDADNDPLTYSVVAGPTHGTLTGTAPNLTYTPTAGYTGSDSFTYKANDGHADSNVATVSITVTPVSPTCSSVKPSVDGSVSANRQQVNTLVAPALSTTQSGDLVLAFVGADGPMAPTQRVTAVTGGGLTWTLAQRANATWGTAEIWSARASGRLSNAVVQAKLANGGFDGSISVVAFSGASGLGAAGTAAAISRTPSVTLANVGCNSLVWASGHDWTHKSTVTPAAGQTQPHLYRDGHVHDSFWTQWANGPTTASASVTVSDTLNSSDRWQLVAVEVSGVPTV